MVTVMKREVMMSSYLPKLIENMLIKTMPNLVLRNAQKPFTYIKVSENMDAYKFIHVFFTLH